jgi:hypothetical protein
MKNKIAAVLLIFAVLGQGSARAAASQPVWKWVEANEYYFILPAAQTIHFSGGDTKNVNPWGFGFRAVGGDAFSQTGALQLQSISTDNSAGKDTIYLLDMLLGMEYKSPLRPGRALRFTAAGFADLGLCDTTLYAAPVLSAGLLYVTDERAETPTGITFSVFYRLTDIDLDNAGGGRAGTLKPALGVKLGYIFEGFWTAREKAKE